jgi:F-box-like
MGTSPLDTNQGVQRCFDMLSALPVELSLHILCFIQQVSTLGRLSTVCKAWDILTQDESIWRLHSERFGYVPMGHGEGHEDWNGWKDYFIKLYISGRVYYIVYIVKSLEILKSVS